MAGFDGKVAGQAAYILEKRNQILPELINCILGQKRVRELTEQDSAINQQIDALALQDGAEKMLEVIEGADGETARRIQFYRDVMSGKIKTVRRTTRYNAMGEKIETKVEEVSDVDTKMKARKELDRILGLNQALDFDKLQVGEITVNIVDASKKDELAPPEEIIDLDPSKVQEINGQTVVVEEEIVEKETAKEQFFNTMGETNE